jgi:hypothetical protein
MVLREEIVGRTTRSCDANLGTTLGSAQDWLKIC